jgi:N-acetylmuramoyl-L-alanine amidase
MQASATGSWDWDAEDSEILLKIAMAEAEGESVEGKALVMLVVLNRVSSEDFPGTIEDVAFQPKQFSPVREGGRYYTTEPDRGCYEALELVMQGWDESGGALYFESCDKDSWHSRNLEFLYQVGKHKFYR